MSDQLQVSQWLKFAHNDLVVAHHACEDMHPKQIFISCYHCQQAAEKALKAFLIFKEQTFPFTHDLDWLCRLCSDITDKFEDIANDCTDLTPYATQARYPNNEEITEPEAESALRKAERIVALCESLIEAANQN